MAFTVSVSATESNVDVANNKSRLTVSLTLNSTYGSWFGDNKTGTITIDGTTYNITYNFPSGTTSKNIGSAYKDITHNSSTGAYTANWSYSIPTNSSQGTKTGSGSTTLTTIARASEPSLSATSVNLNTAVTINTNRKNTAFTHTITYAIGNASGTIGTAKNVTDSVSWTPPYSLADQFPNATSGNVTITCQTYNGNTLVGTKTCTLQVKTIDNTEFKPTIGLSASYTGKFNNNYLLNGISGITVSATNGFKHGATLSSYTISGASKSSTNSSLSLSPINVNMTSASTTLTFSGTVTDSRGYTNTPSNSSNLTATVYRYNNPQITSYSVYRCASSTSSTPSSSGTYAAVVITYTYQNDGYSNSMSTKKITINNNIGEYNLTTTETTSNGVVTGTGTTIVGGGNLAATSTYNYTITCTDAVNKTVTVNGSIPTADRVWSVRPQGKGMAIGKYAEHDNLLESAWKIKSTNGFEGNVTGNVTGNLSGNVTGNLSGNANTATALKEYAFSRNNNSNTWFKVATTTITKNTTYAEKHALLFIKGSHNSNYTQNGIVAIDVVGNSNKAQVGSYQAKFMTATDTLDYTNFYIEYKNGSETADGYANFWIRANTNGYASWRINILYNSGWTIANASPTVTTLPTSGYIGKTSIGSQKPKASLTYGQQSLSNSTAWGNTNWTTVSSSTVIGSGLTIDGAKIKINSDTVKRVKVTAYLISFKSNKTGDVYFAIHSTRTDGNYSPNIIYRNITSAEVGVWQTGSAYSFFITVKKNDTFQCRFGTGAASTTVEHLGINLMVEDVTDY